jgi:hypothetical protein
MAAADRARAAARESIGAVVLTVERVRNDWNEAWGIAGA